MKGIQLKLSGEWVALPEDFSLSLEQNNPLFNNSGVFSFPFEVPLEPNRALFRNISNPFSDIQLKEFNGMEAELWFEGVLLYKGITETEDEIEIKDSIPMTFLSGNGDFMKRIEDLNAQDIPLNRKIKLGYVVTHAESSYLPEDMGGRIYLPSYMMMNYTEYNISDPYPISPFCNVRVCTSNEEGKPKTLNAKRPYSGVCFYMMYLLDCLFTYLKIEVDKEKISDSEDLNRLAFFTTKCDNTLSEVEKVISLAQMRDDTFCGSFFELIFSRIRSFESQMIITPQFTYKAKDVFATNKNFPNISVEELINDLWAAFGLKIICDEREPKVKLVSVKNVFSNNEISDLNLTILSSYCIKNKKKGVLLSYGVSDNTAFNYNDYTNVELYNGYSDLIRSGIDRYNNKCLIDKITGNAYRVKVNKETGGDPSLFEVGAFSDFLVGERTEETAEIKIGFMPVIVNDTKGRRGGTGQVYSVFADVELLLNGMYNDYIRYSVEDNKAKTKIKLVCEAPERYDETTSEESPLRSYDAGYTMGIMRGPGSASGIEYVEDYDGEGNSTWLQTARNYAFTSDTCDNYGRFFDYNGTETGGADQSGRFSLKLVAEKKGFPIDSKYDNRGLVAKFLSEYLYFLEHRKTVLLDVKMNITQLINIDFLKKYKIGYFVGFINKVSYTLTTDGMEDVTIEMYTL